MIANDNRPNFRLGNADVDSESGLASEVTSVAVLSPRRNISMKVSGCSDYWGVVTSCDCDDYCRSDRCRCIMDEPCPCDCAGDLN